MWHKKLNKVIVKNFMNYKVGKGYKNYRQVEKNTL